MTDFDNERAALDRARDIVIATLDSAKSDATKAFDVLAPILRAKLAGKLDKTVDAAKKRGRRPPATLKVKLGERMIGAEFRARVYPGKDDEWTFDTIDIAIVTEDRRNPHFGARLDRSGVRWSRYSAGTGERMARLVTNLLAVTALGKAHFVALNESSHCQICGRALLDERSVEMGIGPECIKHLFGAADAAEIEAAKVEDLLAQIKAIRAEMKAQHPDITGVPVDGALFARLADDLKALRKELAKTEVQK